MTTAMAVLPAVERPSEPPPPLPPSLSSFPSAAGAEVVALAESPPDLVRVGDAMTTLVVEGIEAVEMTVTTVTSPVDPFGLVVGACVTMDVTMFVVCGWEEADMIDVTTLVEPSTVVVLPCSAGCSVVVAGASVVGSGVVGVAIDEEISDAMDEETASAASLLEDGAVKVTVAALSDMLPFTRHNNQGVRKRDRETY